MTSQDGAALRISEVLKSAIKVWRLYWFTVLCRGQPIQIARNQLLNRYGRVDLIIVGRGGSFGGLMPCSEEWCKPYFNQVPVISAVNHAVDATLADQLQMSARLLPPKQLKWR